MRDVLAGGSLTLSGATLPIGSMPAKTRRQSIARRSRTQSHRRPDASLGTAVPGQLASPHLKCGFPSLALH